MDVMYFLFKGLDKLARLLVWITFRTVVFLFRRSTSFFNKKARGKPDQQEVKYAEAQTVLTPPQDITAPQPQTIPPIHVHVHLEQGQPQPVATLPPVQNAETATPTTILSRPDHRIYITTGSQFILEHPSSEELLTSLDHMLYIAAHRDGVPFMVAPPLDESGNGRSVTLKTWPMAPVDETEFFSTEGRPLPPSDGTIWLRKAGEMPQQLATSTPS